MWKSDTEQPETKHMRQVKCLGVDGTRLDEPIWHRHRGGDRDRDWDSDRDGGERHLQPEVVATMCSNVG